MATHTLPSGLTRHLIQNGLLSESQATEHYSKYDQVPKNAQGEKATFLSYLINGNIISGRGVANIASREFGFPLFDLDAMDLSLAPIKLVSEKLIRKHRILPLFQRGNKLFVALSDPTKLGAVDEIRFHARMNTETVLVEDNKLTQAIEAVLEAADASKMQDIFTEDGGDFELLGEEDESSAEDSTAPSDEDAPIVRFVNKILLDAIKKGASDIHFEPYEKSFRIRFRTDGMLHEVASPPQNMAGRLSARLKVMSRMDIAERRVPQDGRIKMKLSKHRAIDFRVNTCPTLYGEKIVLRILDPTSAEIGIEKLGFEEEQQKNFLEAIHKPYGMVLVTGPTGSGKTVSLYTGLNILNTVDTNISTAEDPVEITVAGINQVNMNPKAGLTFAEALRAFLRQDPDIIMVGEIRDLETAEIAIKAAQTGHMVLSTLHTNDAPQTLTRLLQMGIPAFNIASSVNLIMAQRLARRLCESCKAADDLPKKALLEAGFKADELDDLIVYKPVGCDKCVRGYKGRVGIYQVMPITEAITAIIMRGGNSLELAEQATADGIDDLRISGLKKIRAGITSLEEINRVTKD